MKQVRFDILREARTSEELVSQEEIASIVHKSTASPRQSIRMMKRGSAIFSIAALMTTATLFLIFHNKELTVTQQLPPQQKNAQKLSAISSAPAKELHSLSDFHTPQKNTSRHRIVSSSAFIESPSHSEAQNTEKSIIAMNALELSRDELAKLGVILENNVLKTRIQERENSSEYTVSEIYIGKNTWRSTFMSSSAIDDTTVFLHPVLITYSSPQGYESSSSFIVNHSTLLSDALIPTSSLNQIAEDAKIGGATLPLLNQLVPVRVTMPQTNDIVTLWYIPEQLFYMALPERYVLPIKNELQVQTDITCKHIQREDACGAFRGKTTVFDICSSDAGSITQSSVYPNPAHGSAQCRYVLVQPRQCRITLYTAEGQFVKELLPWSDQEAGEQIVRLGLDDIHGGLYLLSLTTEQGENIIQRLFIQ